MKKHSLASLSEICRLDDWQTFDAYLQNEITAGDSHSILQDDSLQAILSAKNIFAAFLARYDGGFFVHPLLCRLLHFAVTHSAVYEKPALEIVEFGIKHNRAISKRLRCDSILQNGDLLHNNKIVGRALVFSATEEK